jgi:hypothetical protein
MAVALLIAASLSAQPAQLVLGKDPGADLEIRAPATAKVTFSTSVGTISAVQRQGNVVRARFNAPPLRVPSVALVLAQIDEGSDRELRWLSIPLSGSDTMVIETRPGSKVEASIAGRVIVGPVPAAGDGTVRLAMVVPPGVRTATLKITDKLGNSTEKPLDLAPPPFSRVRLASRSEAASAAAPLEVEIFVVKPDGSPDDDAKVALAAADGETSLQKRIGPGVYLAEYQPAEARTGSARLEAKANGQLATLDVPVRAAPAGSRQSFWRTGMSPQPWELSAGLLAGFGGSFDGASAGSVLAELALRVESYPVEALLDLGGTFLSEVSQYTAVPALAEKAKAKAWIAQIGARGSYEVMRRVDVHASLAFGLQNQNVRITLPLNLGRFDNSGLSARLAVAVGVSYGIGPGRALAQVELDWTSKHVAQLAGSTSGVQGTIGYLVPIR